MIVRGRGVERWDLVCLWWWVSWLDGRGWIERVLTLVGEK